MVYFLVGAENLFGDSDKTFSRITTELGNLATIKNRIDVQIRDFKLSNVDQLISSNEAMLKMETHIESILKKIERTYMDITESQHAEFQVNTRSSSVSLSQYVQDFKWDNNIFSRSQPLMELLKSFQQKATTIDNDIRQKQQVLQEAKNNLNSVALKEGNLLVKDLSDVFRKEYVKEKDFIYTENLTTVVAIVPNNVLEHFQQQYELMHHCVVPGSAKQFEGIQDKDYTVWRIVIFKLDYKNLKKILLEGEKLDENGKRQKTPVEEFISASREKLKVTVKEFQYNENDCAERERQRTAFQTQANSQSGKLRQTCEKSFGNLYEVYIHLKFLRLVVEIAAKFGQKSNNTTCLIQPAPGKEKQVQQKLLKLFADRAQLDAGMYGTKEELEDTEDFFPYAYVPITV
ncbi:vacuolar ATP synthase subunit C (macronuclear) [Tetrahymena thermophila SB210]|uniref:V-type proton ATPase subunit C n=1 Tax=Tetrahymena thermophila (strain SB210) TaxID=312017 RepID=Q234G6_TETTS|nr:vacuolar ATP synthase subunit C [Tetrahymena thermophila SB210]EAR92037.2 vacuolar ATP synthase subunit C [Tetrahymena thermophila SB210]|eukprot:XP_001012282.2 vacuolar ATP synthase subunit C [Tetrahymena thermophila SB210]